jgi:hypothetical protein
MNEPHDPNQTADIPSVPADSLDAGLAAGFGRPADGPGSVLADLRPSLGPLRPVPPMCRAVLSALHAALGRHQPVASVVEIVGHAVGRTAAGVCGLFGQAAPGHPNDAKQGSYWDHAIIDPETKLIISMVVGRRTADTVVQVFTDFYDRRDRGRVRHSCRQRYGGPAPAHPGRAADRDRLDARSDTGVFGRLTSSVRKGKTGESASPGIRWPRGRVARGEEARTSSKRATGSHRPGAGDAGVS